MTFLIIGVIILVIILFLVSVSISNPTEKRIEIEKQALLKKLSTTKIQAEVDNNHRIFKDSMEIVGKTNNINTMLSRKKDLLNIFDWYENMRLSGVPVTISSSSGREIDRIYFFEYLNNNLIRLIEYNYQEYIMTISLLQTDKAKDNRTIKMLELLELCRDNLGSAQNIHETAEKIDYYKNMIEDLYSDFYKQ